MATNTLDNLLDQVAGKKEANDWRPHEEWRQLVRALGESKPVEPDHVARVMSQLNRSAEQLRAAADQYHRRKVLAAKAARFGELRKLVDKANEKYSEVTSLNSQGKIEPMAFAEIEQNCLALRRQLGEAEVTVPMELIRSCPYPELRARVEEIRARGQERIEEEAAERRQAEDLQRRWLAVEAQREEYIRKQHPRHHIEDVQRQAAELNARHADVVGRADKLHTEWERIEAEAKEAEKALLEP